MRPCSASIRSSRRSRRASARSTARPARGEAPPGGNGASPLRARPRPALRGKCAPTAPNTTPHASVGAEEATHDAETAPLAHPEHYQYDIDTAKVAEVWRRGSVVASWLLDLTAAALQESPTLDGFGGRVSDSGEGRWTLAAA